MKTLDLLRTFFTPRKKGIPSLSLMESKLQPAGTEKRPKRLLVWAMGAIVAVAVVISLFNRVIPLVNEHFPRFMAGLAPELQFLVLAIIMPLL